MTYTINELEKNRNIICDLLQSFDEIMILWRPQPAKWCVLEIACHLYDEERLDFRFRTKWVLEKPGETPPPFNPLDWLEEHNYLGQDYNDMIAKFREERDSSIKWLRTLNNPNWTSSYNHNKLGKLTANYFFSNWLAHDYLHIRQLTKLKFDYLEKHSGENLEYAGIW